jgi:hypothetical protein
VQRYEFSAFLVPHLGQKIRGPVGSPETVLVSTTFSSGFVSSSTISAVTERIGLAPRDSLRSMMDPPQCSQ